MIIDDVINKKDKSVKNDKVENINKKKKSYLKYDKKERKGITNMIISEISINKIKFSINKKIYLVNSN